MELAEEYAEADEKTDGVAAIGRQIKKEGEIEYGSNDGLRHVVGEAHLAIVAQPVDAGAESLMLVEQHERGYEHKSKCQFLPHVERSTCGLLYQSAPLHDFIAERVERCKGNGTDDQGLEPETRVALIAHKEPFASEICADEEESCRLPHATGTYSHIKLATCPVVMLHHRNWSRLPLRVASPTVSYRAPTP